MKTNLILTAALTLLSASLFAADTSPKDSITNAVKALGEKANYSWKTTVVVPEGTPFRPGPTEGQCEKSGLILLKMTFGDNTTQAVMKGEKGAVSNPDGGWDSLTELQNAEGPRRFFGMMMRNYKAPVAQAQEIAGLTQDLKKDGEVYSGNLTEDGAKALITFRRGGNNAPAVNNAKGTAKFWLKNGMLDKYEFTVKGSMNFNGNDVDIDRTTTVEIKDVGTTKLTIPEDAKKKLE